MAFSYGERVAAIRAALEEPRTVAQVAALLQMDTDRVKGLINYLRGLHLVARVGETPMPSGQTAALYQRVEAQ